MLIFQFLLFFFTNFLPADNNICNQTNSSFLAGEKIHYSIFYNVIGIYVNAGKADFNTISSSLNGTDTYTFTALAKHCFHINLHAILTRGAFIKPI